MSVVAGQTGHLYITVLGNGKRGFGVRMPSPGSEKSFENKDFTGNAVPLQELLLQAEKWRNARYEALYGCSLPSRTFHETQSNNRATGVPGVRRQIKVIHSKYKSGNRTPTTHQVAVYIAEIWLEPGKDGKRATKSRSKVFSVAKYGEDLACTLALVWRKEMQQRLLTDGVEGFERWWVEAREEKY